jgi:hypothetical protein
VPCDAFAGAPIVISCVGARQRSPIPPRLARIDAATALCRQLRMYMLSVRRQYLDSQEGCSGEQATESLRPLSSESLSQWVSTTVSLTAKPAEALTLPRRRRRRASFGEQDRTDSRERFSCGYHSTSSHPIDGPCLRARSHDALLTGRTFAYVRTAKCDICRKAPQQS